MDILICLIAFHCLSYTFHCYLTYDPDYFRGADRFPGWDSLCLDPPRFRIDFVYMYGAQAVARDRDCRTPMLPETLGTANADCWRATADVVEVAGGHIGAHRRPPDR